MLRTSDLMSGTPETIGPEAHLHEAMTTMNRVGCRQLPVVADGRLVGIITDRDVRLAINSPFVAADADLSREKVLDGVAVGDCMTPNPQCVAPDLPAHEVADLLALTKFGAMPVVDDGKPVGMISTIDILRHFAATAKS